MRGRWHIRHRLAASALFFLSVLGTAWAEQAESGQAAPTVEELLKGNPQADDYVDEPRCIRTHAIRSTEVIDECLYERHWPKVTEKLKYARDLRFGPTYHLNDSEII